MYRSVPDNINPFRDRSERDKFHASAKLKGINTRQPPVKEPGQKAVRCSVIHDKKNGKDEKRNIVPFFCKCLKGYYYALFYVPF